MNENSAITVTPFHRRQRPLAAFARSTVAAAPGLAHVTVMVLEWHNAATTMALEALPAWALTTLRGRLPFSGVLWGWRSAGDVSSASAVIHSSGLGPQAISALCHHHTFNPGTDSASPREHPEVAREAPWAADILQHRGDGLDQETSHALTAQVPSSAIGSGQFLVLTRAAHGPPFSAAEAADFALLAPHLMRAYATCLKFTLANAHFASTTATGMAVALVDTTGRVRDEQAGFMPLMQLEWKGWPGWCLPEPLANMAETRAGTSWRFVGEHVCADFVPVTGLYLVTARPRHAIDVLTERESDVARRYAAGGDFRQIATALQLSPATVRSHLRNVFSKLKVRSKAQLTELLR